MTAAGCPLGPPPAHRGCPTGTVPNAGDQQQGPAGASPSCQSPGPFTYRQRVPPAACKRRAGLEGGCGGERHQARATSHRHWLGGGGRRPIPPPVLNQGGGGGWVSFAHPKSQALPIFAYSWVLPRASHNGCSAGLGARIQPSSHQALSLAHTGGRGFVPPKPAMGTHF